MPSWLPTALLAPLIAFALYRRFTRTFGRQLLRVRRMVFRLVLLSVVCVVLLVFSHTGPMLGAALAGALVGLGLAALALRHTRFEVEADAVFYTTNGWIGLAVTALFLARLAARLVALHAQQAPSIQRSPLTLAITFVMAGYYLFFYGGVLRRSRSMAMRVAAE